MHILFAVHGYKPAYRLGGPIITLAETAERLTKRGHKVSVFTTTCNLDQDLDVPVDQPQDVDGVQVWYFRREQPLKRLLPFVPYLSKSTGYLYSHKISRTLDQILPEVDVVHAQMPFVHPTHAACWAALRHDKPLFYNQHGVFDPARLRFRSLKKRVFLNLVEKPILRKATTLISLTEFETQSYRMLGVSTPSEVVPNGIETSRYWQELPREWDQKLGIASKDLMILFMGRLHPIKGADRLLKAFLKIEKNFPNAVLVMAGPDEFGLEETFKKQVSQNHLDAKVIFPGMVSGDLKKALLARADLFCLPSDAEGFSMAILEAMASRTAVLISPGCHFQKVQTSGAGVVCSLEPESIASSLQDLLNDRQHLGVMGREGLKLVRREYNWEDIVDKLVGIYEQALDGRRTKDNR